MYSCEKKVFEEPIPMVFVPTGVPGVIYLERSSLVIRMAPTPQENFSASEFGGENFHLDLLVAVVFEETNFRQH